MKLIPEKEIESVSKSDRWFEGIGTPSSDFQLGFILGSNWTQDKLTPLMIEFDEWCSKNYLYTTELNWSAWNTSTQFFTTKQLLEQFLKTKQL